MNFADEVIEEGELCKELDVLEFWDFGGDIGELLAIQHYLAYDERYV